MKTKIKQFRITFKNIVVIAGLLLATAIPLIPQHANAVFTNAYLRLDRMSDGSTATGGTVCAKPATTATEADVQVTFPTDFGVDTTFGNWTVTTTDLPAGGSAWLGINTATAAASKTVTFPSSDLTVGTLYCFNFTGTATLTTSVAAAANQTGTIKTRTGAAATVDLSSYATAVITDDQITVNATVSATFSMSIGTCGSNTDDLGTLSTSSIISSSAACRLTITTNAQNGWIVWAKDSQQGLYSTTKAYTIPGSSTMDDNCAAVDDDITAGTEGFGVDSNIITDAAGGGTITIDGDFDCGANFVGDYDTIFTEIATANGPTSGDIIDLVHEAAISGLTEAAADYSDIVTVTGAGNF